MPQSVATDAEHASTPSDTLPTGPLHPGLPDPSKFPLYRPPPQPKEKPPKQIDLDNLPTEEEIDIAVKQQITDEAIRHVPPFSEEDLREFYKNVVLSGAAESAKEILPQIAAPQPRTEPDERQHLLANLTRRLLEPSKDGESSPLVPALDTNIPKHMALTAALMKIAPEAGSQFTVPTGLVTKSEWRALFDSFVSSTV